MKVLMIAPQPFFSPRGTPFSVYYRALVMAEQGVEIDLLTYGRGRDVEIPGVRIVRIPRFGFLGPVKVGPSALKAFLDLFLLAWAVALLLRNRYDFVDAHEEGAFLFLPLEFLFSVPIVYEMHSSLPQQLENFGFTRSRLLIGLFERLEDACLRRAEAVVTISPALAEYARARMPEPSRHFLIENSVLDPVRLRRDGSDAEEESDGSVRGEEAVREGIPPSRRVVAYIGTFERYQGLDLLVPAFRRVRKRCPDAFLLMVGGDGGQVERYRRMAADRELTGNCHIIGRVDHETARRYLSRADVLVSPRTGGNTPLKIYEALESGVPLVATRIAAHTQVVDESVCFLVEADPESLARGIVAALQDEGRRQRVVTDARALYRKRYGRKAYERKIVGLLRSLGGVGRTVPSPLARADREG